MRFKSQNRTFQTVQFQVSIALIQWFLTFNTVLSQDKYLKAISLDLELEELQVLEELLVLEELQVVQPKVGLVHQLEVVMQRHH